MKYLSNNTNDTIALGKRIGKKLKPGDVVALIGNLGAGKTVFTKGIAEGLGVKAAKYVNSPTFVLIKQYKGKLPLYHFDLYRMDSQQQVKEIGYEEYFYGDGVTVVEWADKIKELLPKKYLRVQFSIKGKEKRQIKYENIGS